MKKTAVQVKQRSKRKKKHWARERDKNPKGNGEKKEILENCKKRDREKKSRTEWSSHGDGRKRTSKKKK